MLGILRISALYSYAPNQYVIVQIAPRFSGSSVSVQVLCRCSQTAELKPQPRLASRATTSVDLERAQCGWLVSRAGPPKFGMETFRPRRRGARSGGVSAFRPNLHRYVTVGKEGRTCPAQLNERGPVETTANSWRRGIDSNPHSRVMRTLPQTTGGRATGQARKGCFPRKGPSRESYPRTRADRPPR